VPKDVARGVALFKQAAAGGIKPAADSLRELGEPFRRDPSCDTLGLTYMLGSCIAHAATTMQRLVRVPRLP
jgi:hypothetical protein